MVSVIKIINNNITTCVLIYSTLTSGRNDTGWIVPDTGWIVPVVTAAGKLFNGQLNFILILN